MTKKATTKTVKEKNANENYLAQQYTINKEKVKGYIIRHNQEHFVLAKFKNGAIKFEKCVAIPENYKSILHYDELEKRSYHRDGKRYKGLLLHLDGEAFVITERTQCSHVEEDIENIVNINHEAMNDEHSEFTFTKVVTDTERYINSEKIVMKGSTKIIDKIKKNEYYTKRLQAVKVS